MTDWGWHFEWLLTWKMTLIFVLLAGEIGAVVWFDLLRPFGARPDRHGILRGISAGSRGKP